MEQNKITILLKPGVSAQSWVTTLKTSGFKFDKTISMGKEGDCVVGWCNQATRAFIKALPNVVDIEDSHPMTICLDEDGNEIKE